MLLKKIIAKTSDFMMMIAVFSLSTAVLVNIAEITRRFLFGKSYLWIQDVTLLAMMWFIFPGIVKISHSNGDIMIDYFISKFSDKARHIITIATSLLVTLFCGNLFYYSLKLGILRYSKVTPAAGIPYIYYSLAMIISCFLLTAVYLDKTIQEIKNSNAKECADKC